MKPETTKRKSRRGQSLVEFTFVAIPVMFLLISVFEISRGMWIYHTLAFSVREGVRFASVHGADCVNNPPLNYNSCQVSYADIAGVVQYYGVGLVPATTQLQFYGCTTTTSCTLDNTCPLNGCGATKWPLTSGTPGENAVGNLIRIDIQTPFRSAIAMFWPGSRSVSFGAVTLPSTSMDTIKF